MKCPNCGKEIANDSLFCEYCGKPVKQQRHGFVTFWLWLMIIANVCATFAYFSEATSSRGDNNTILMYTSAVCSVICVLGATLLLKWKKWGFWLIVVNAAAHVFATIYLCNEMAHSYIYYSSNYRYHEYPTVPQEMLIFSTAFSLLILFAILHIKKDGKSCWSLLK